MIERASDCISGKMSYPTQQWARRLAGRWHPGERRYRAYWCRACGCWHLTSRYHKRVNGERE